MAKVLIVDDEEGIRGMLSVVLRRDQHAVSTASSGDEALAMLTKDPHDIVITDLRMDGMTGTQLLGRIKAEHPTTFVIMMTAYAEWDTAVAAMRSGAFNFIAKPFDNELVRSVIRRAAGAREHYLAARELDGEHANVVHLVGASRAIHDIQELIEQVSATEATILVTGESGSGKELVASAIHYSSLRSDRSFMRINCGALTPTLLESELFGHVKGAFTGAIEDRPGVFELANGGTLFLDEVGDLATETQVKLLRVLENGEFLPVGGREVRTADVRIVAATNKNLKAMVAAGTFREDLYYRLAVIAIHLPALHEREEDIPLLAGHLLARHAVRLRRGVDGFEPDAVEALCTYRWPGNVRELDNRIQRGVALTQSGTITVDALFGDMAASNTEMWRAIRGERVTKRVDAGNALERKGSGRRGTTEHGADSLLSKLRAGASIDLEDEVRTFEKRLLSEALKATDDNLTEAAKKLGLSFRQIRYKAKQLGLR